MPSATRPQHFKYRACPTDHPELPPAAWSVHAPRFGKAGGPWALLGTVEPDERTRAWVARVEHEGGEDALGGFPDHERAAYFLWRRHAERLDQTGQSALEEAMPEKTPPGPLPGPNALPAAPWDAERPESEFRRLCREAGLSIADGTRAAGALNAKTGRRWARGVDHDGAAVSLPEASRRLLVLLVEEHRRARALENEGMGTQPRPLRDRLLSEAKARETDRRRQRQAEGKARDPSRGHGPQRRATREARAAARAAVRAGRPGPLEGAGGGGAA